MFIAFIKALISPNMATNERERTGPQGSVIKCQGRWGHNETSKTRERGTERPRKHTPCMRVNETDEASALLAAYRMTLGLNAKDIFFSHFFAEYQLICSECYLRYNHYTERWRVLHRQM